MIPHPFCPQYGSNQVVTLAAATPQVKTITADSQSLLVVNSGAGDLYVRTYSSFTTPAPVASNADYPVISGKQAVIRVGDVHDRISLYSLAGTTAQVMTGDGGV